MSEELNAGGIAGGVLGTISNVITNKMNRDFEREKFEYQKAQDELQHTREDTAIQRKVQDAYNAGISPITALGGSGASTTLGGTSVGSLGQESYDPSNTINESIKNAMQKKMDDANVNAINATVAKTYNEIDIEQQRLLIEKQARLDSVNRDIETARHNKATEKDQKEKLEIERSKLENEIKELQDSHEKTMAEIEKIKTESEHQKNYPYGNFKENALDAAAKKGNEGFNKLKESINKTEGYYVTGNKFIDNNTKFGKWVSDTFFKKDQNSVKKSKKNNGWHGTPTGY